jgi:thiol-disulfide isomerase/thioredoxin
MNGAFAVIAVLAAASAFGIWRQRTDGRVRRIAAVPEPGLEAPSPSPFAAFGEMGEHATIVQFSATVCAPCRAAKVIAGEVARQVPGVTHVEVNAEENMELVKEFGIMRTPTILVLDGQGRLSARISGVPRRDELLVALDDRRYEDI